MREFTAKSYDFEVKRRSELNSSITTFYTLTSALLGGVALIVYKVVKLPFSFEILAGGVFFSSFFLIMNIPIIKRYFREDRTKKHTNLLIVTIWAIIAISDLVAIIYFKLGVLENIKNSLIVGFLLPSAVYTFLITFMLLRIQINFRYDFLWTPQTKEEYRNDLVSYVDRNYDKESDKAKAKIVDELLEEKEEQIAREFTEINNTSNNDKEELISLFKREFYLFSMVVIAGVLVANI